MKAYKCDSCGAFTDRVVWYDFYIGTEKDGHTTKRKMDLCPNCARKLTEKLKIMNLWKVK